MRDFWDIWNNNILYSFFHIFIYFFLFVGDIFYILYWWNAYLLSTTRFHRRSRKNALFSALLTNDAAPSHDNWQQLFFLCANYNCRGSYTRCWRDSRLRANNPQDYSRKGFLHCCCASAWATISSSSPLNEHERRQTLRWT